MCADVAIEYKPDMEEEIKNTRITDGRRNEKGQNCKNEKVWYDKMITKSCAWLDY